MRRMKADLEAAREALGRAEKPKPMHEVHRKIRCSWPTAAEDRNPTFDTSAVAYLSAVWSFDATPTPASYEGIISACLACHANTCPGPGSAIQTLHLPPATR
jgi:hypothetical protein